MQNYYNNKTGEKLSNSASQQPHNRPRSSRVYHAVSSHRRNEELHDFLDKRRPPLIYSLLMHWTDHVWKWTVFHRIFFQLGVNLDVFFNKKAVLEMLFTEEHTNVSRKRPVRRSTSGAFYTFRTCCYKKLTSFIFHLDICLKLQSVTFIYYLLSRIYLCLIRLDKIEF